MLFHGFGEFRGDDVPGKVLRVGLPAALGELDTERTIGEDAKESRSKVDWLVWLGQDDACLRDRWRRLPTLTRYHRQTASDAGDRATAPGRERTPHKEHRVG